MRELGQYTNVIRAEENVYYLNKEGREFTGATRKHTANSQLQHKLMRNDAYIYFCPTEWYPEREIKVGKLRVIPDVLMYSGSTYKCIEVDNMQKMSVNRKKFRYYKDLKDTGAFQKQYGHFPTIIWIIEVSSRVDKLHKLAEEYGLHCEVYLRDDIR